MNLDNSMFSPVEDIPEHFWRQQEFVYYTKDEKKIIIKKPDQKLRRKLASERSKQAWENIQQFRDQPAIYKELVAQLTKNMLDDRYFSLESLLEYVATEQGLLTLVRLCTDGNVTEEQLLKEITELDRRPENGGLILQDIIAICVYSLAGCLLGKEPQQLWLMTQTQKANPS